MGNGLIWNTGRFGVEKALIRPLALTVRCSNQRIRHQRRRLDHESERLRHLSRIAGVLIDAQRLIEAAIQTDCPQQRMLRIGAQPFA